MLTFLGVTIKSVFVSIFGRIAVLPFPLLNVAIVVAAAGES